MDSTLAYISKYLLFVDSFGFAATLNQNYLSTIRKQANGDIFLGYLRDTKDLLCRLHHIIQVYCIYRYQYMNWQIVIQLLALILTKINIIIFTYILIT